MEVGNDIFGEKYLQGPNITIAPKDTENLSKEISHAWVSCGYGIKKRAPIVKYALSETGAIYIVVKVSYS